MPGRPSRRGLLTLAGILAGIYTLRAVPWGTVFAPALSYREIEGLSPFRRIDAGDRISSVSGAFVGIHADDAGQAVKGTAAAVHADLCAALFGGGASDGRVPVAYFSDFQCPYCRVLERDLDDIAATRSAEMRLVEHELPIFGPSSELAARASVAAANQGMRRPLRRSLMRTPLLPNAASIGVLAAGMGIDTEQLFRDMDSAAVTEALARSRALADLFGFFGTPGLVIGRTVISGSVSRAMLNRIIDEEAKLPSLACMSE